MALRVPTLNVSVVNLERGAAAKPIAGILCYTEDGVGSPAQLWPTLIASWSYSLAAPVFRN